jgi:lipoprotein-releasing system permease protein
MYKLLLSWRYLRSRYIALASIISVTLGVATLIIVNAVMAGFTAEMNKRLNGILSDIVVESHSLGGFPNPEWHQDQIREIVGADLAGLTATVHVPAMLSIRVGDQYVTRQVNLIGIDEATYARVSDFSQYLLHPANQRQLSFHLRDSGYAPGREDFPQAGWQYRRERVLFERAYQEQLEIEQAKRAAELGLVNGAAEGAGQFPPPDTYGQVPPADPTGGGEEGGKEFDPLQEQWSGVILGIAICSQRVRDANGEVHDRFFCRPGDDVQITLPNAATPPRAVDASLTVVDFYESKMSEYDSSFAFMPLRELQDLRGMIHPVTNVSSVTAIQIKLKPGVDLNAVRDRLRARFPLASFPYRIQTWRDMQGPLLAAVRLETTILNILLFLIIAVAGFGILATFFMIVVEKTRDVGVLKALGAPSRGVMSIFLGYGLSLGLVGSGVGTVLGLLFVHHINAIAAGLEWVTGKEVFDQTVYYFREIPVIIQPHMVLGVLAGAVLIAVLASVLPARHAARLHPVEALRYE